MHDDRIVGQPPQPRRVEAPAPGVLALAREECGVHALELDAQHHHRVRLLGEGLVEVVAHAHGPPGDVLRDQRGGRHERDVGAERAQQPHVGARDPGVQHVSDDDDAKAREVLPAAVGAEAALADREGVEQRLGGMLVRAVAGVDDARGDPAARGEGARRAGRRVPHDDRVRAHRLQGLRGVLQALALRDAGSLRREVDHVGREPLRRGFERDPGAGGVLEEQVHDGLAAQRRQLLHFARLRVGHVLGDVEDPQRVVAGERARVEQVPHATSPSIDTRSSPSSSRRCTFTRS